ncbi:hypothetical protein V2J09_000880, partial [Rumex salicifolius]
HSSYPNINFVEKEIYGLIIKHIVLSVSQPAVGSLRRQAYDMIFLSTLRLPCFYPSKPFSRLKVTTQESSTEFGSGYGSTRRISCSARSSDRGILRQNMSKRRILLFLKPLDDYLARISQGLTGNLTNPKILRHLEDRLQVHNDAINFCKDVLKRKSIDWELCLHDGISKPIQNVDLVVTIGGDGTLLKASRFLDNSIPVLGVNSDPTRPQEVEKLHNEFDAARSTGYLCAATVENFEQVLIDIIENRTSPYELSRISLSLNSQHIETAALNDLLIAHPCPAALSRFSFRIRKNDESSSPLVSCRSSGLRVSTPAGSTAAMLSAGGFVMPILSNDLQYMVREPMSSSNPLNTSLMHGVVKSNQTMETVWLTEEGVVYIDGSNVSYPVRHGDVIKISSNAPNLKIFLAHNVLSSRL